MTAATDTTPAVDPATRVDPPGQAGEVETLLVCVGDEGQEVAVTVSIGVATLHQGSGMSFEELVNRADQALYQAKGTGRNAVYCADMPPAEGGVVEQVPLDLGGGGYQP